MYHTLLYCIFLVLLFAIVSYLVYAVKVAVRWKKNTHLNFSLIGQAVFSDLGLNQTPTIHDIDFKGLFTQITKGITQ